MTSTTKLPAWLETLAASWDGCMHDAPGEMIDIGASIRTAASQAPTLTTAPVGYVLVPETPTAEMVAAYRKGGCSVFAMPGWRALLEAIPTRTAEGGAALAATPEAQAEHEALRNVYESARAVLRYDGVDQKRAVQERDGLIEAIEAVKTIDAGYWEPAPAAGVPAAATDALTQAARDVLDERKRQQQVEGYEKDADDEYVNGELASASATYALLASGAEGWRITDHWPWSGVSLKVADSRRMAIKSGALILAEIERIDRAAIAAQAKGEQA